MSDRIGMQKKRVVHYQGKTFYLLDNYKYVAADPDGRVFAFEHEPVWNSARREYNDGGRGKIIQIGEIPQLKYPVVAL